MTPELFDLIVADTRRAHGFSNEYRSVNEHACIYRHIPGGRGRRFLQQDKSVIELLIEVIVAADKAGLEMDAIINLTYHVIAKYKATNICFSDSHNAIVVDYCAHVILNPNFFQEHGQAVYRDISELKSSKKGHQKIVSQLSCATKGQFNSHTWYTLEAKEALKFVAFIGAESKDIPSLIHDLKQRIPFLTEILGPFELAAYLHQKIIEIHPYVDGNGRVARALMNAVLAHAGYASMNIKKTASLEGEYDRAADQMNYREFAQWLKKNYFKTCSGKIFCDNPLQVEAKEDFSPLQRPRGCFFEPSTVRFDDIPISFAP